MPYLYVQYSALMMNKIRIYIILVEPPGVIRPAVTLYRKKMFYMKCYIPIIDNAASGGIFDYVRNHVTELRHIHGMPEYYAPARMAPTALTYDDVRKLARARYPVDLTKRR